ncbi:threonyl-tRNA synthetase [Thermosulfidibacter takaii ABI70S6]|uniref:Threonine--tRNA ligase n=1 Tax=Thermosulfidibacter takaii (strain DSM 17441 / JCM 13301 / NBRC 103674 / ABI70S6) TaxID=1298851 RepID=A0A0S3QUU1_THET7|nr:threonine--tRNA ligase [Thermosulfidibacter takaii]BAT72083.1 threonyl-tRNA synthetase [Thermosulfidibacter takaii ABI70S6]
MIEVGLSTGEKGSFEKGISVGEVIAKLNAKLKNKVIAAKVNGRPVDLSYKLNESATVEPLTFDDPEGREIFWHSTAHIMAAAVKRLFPQVKVTIGPAIENGFYYDFDFERGFTPEDLEKIEAEMTKIVEENHPFERLEMPKDEAYKLFKEMGEDYKLEILDEIEDEVVSLYKTGEFIDLCRGPHIPSTGYVKAFKLTSVAGAYWRGDERNKMLQRIYGISFPTPKQLREYLRFLEEAKKRDHRKLGKELKLFLIEEEVGPGLVIWLPKGAVVRKIIEDYWKEKHEAVGYQLIYTPHVGKAQLWETSGHLSYYKENMFPEMKIENVSYFVKPMNCPFHIQVYKSELRSYRDLPIRLAELGTVYRYEKSGVLHGLLRVRGFTQDDAHIFCREDQVEDEIKATVQFAINMLNDFGFEDLNIYISTKPEKAIGTEEMWEVATQSLIKAVEDLELKYEIEEGEGAFYGPKIDITINDAIGREWQCSTVQFDFNLPEKFDLTYRDKDGTEKRPYMIHRALLGSLERFFGVLIEHYAGNFPLWLAPVQVRVMSITDDQVEYCLGLVERLKKEGIRAEADVRNEKIGYKIRQAEVEKIPYMLVVGQKEVENNLVSVRRKGKGNLGTLSIEEFIDRLKTEIENKAKEV